MSLVSPSLAKRYDGHLIKYKKNDSVFKEGAEANFFYQIEEGTVKMVTSSEDGQEFIQGIFKDGESFGEPPLFSRFQYPASAYCMVSSFIVRIRKDKFLDLLKENFEIHLKLDQILCERLRYKNMILSEVSFHDPEHRLDTLLKHLKNSFGNKGEPFEIPLTRQNIADMTGMRVETVIRCIKRMEANGKLKLNGRKILI